MAMFAIGMIGLLYIILGLADLENIYEYDEDSIEKKVVDLFFYARNLWGKFLIVILYILVLPASIFELVLVFPICLIKSGFISSKDAFSICRNIIGI